MNKKIYGDFQICISMPLGFIRPMPNSIYNIYNPLRVKHLSRLRIEISHLKEHKFKHNFQDSIDPMCNCKAFIFFLHYANFNTQDKPSLDKIATIDVNISTEN